MPVLYPAAIAMAFELCAYVLFIGLIYKLISERTPFNRHDLIPIYISLISSMLLGRIVWGLAQLILLGIKGSAFTFAAFFAGAFANAVPGIIIQIVLVPGVVMAIKRVKA